MHFDVRQVGGVRARLDGYSKRQHRRNIRGDHDHSAAAVGTAVGTANHLTTVFTPTVGGQFELCGFGQITVAASGGTSYALVYNYVANSHNSGTNNMATLSSVTTQYSSTNACVNFYADAGSAIQAGYTTSGITGTPSFFYTFALLQLQ